MCRQSFAAADRCIQDDRSSIRKQRKRLLHSKKKTFHVNVKDRVKNFLGDVTEGGILGSAGVGEHNIELILLSPDLSEEPIEIAKVRRVSIYSGHVFSYLLNRSAQFRIPAPRYEDKRAFFHRVLRGSKTDSASGGSDGCDFSFKLAHGFLLGRPFCCSPISAIRITN